MPIDFDIGDGADALGRNQLSDALDGTYWVSGWDATLGTGDLEVDIAAGSGAINGGDVSTGSTQTVDFTGDPDPDDPRKAVISVDDTGTVQKTLGTAVPAAPTDEIRFRTYDPQPPTSAPGVVVAEVWLAAGATSLVSDDVRDRRVSNDAVEGVGNQPQWVEDSNSPATASASSITYTLGGTYDLVKVVIQVDIDTTTSLNSLDLTINSDTGSNYESRRTDGTRATNDKVRASAYTGPDVLNTQFELSGVWESAATYRGPAVQTRIADNFPIDVIAQNGAVTSPLSQFTLADSRGDTVNWTVRVYGLNVT